MCRFSYGAHGHMCYGENVRKRLEDFSKHCLLLRLPKGSEGCASAL
jgi:hypothetical protein